MTAKPVIIDATCPGCKKDHSVAVPLDDLQLAVGRVQKDEFVDIDEKIEKAFEKRMPKEEPKPQVVKEEVTKMPSWMPGEFCADGSCGAPHKNKNYAQKPKKKCSNCDQFAPEKAKKCAWCKGTDFNELDDDELESIGIPEPEHDHHEHEH